MSDRPPLPRPVPGPGVAEVERMWQELHDRRVSVPSYHDRIQSAARAIERERRQTYDRSTAPRFTLQELQYLSGALHKLLRVTGNGMSNDDILDDVVDSYNYCALLFDAVSARSPQQGVVSTLRDEPADDTDVHCG